VDTHTPTANTILARWRTAKGRGKSADTLDTILEDTTWLIHQAASHHTTSPDDLTIDQLDARTLATIFHALPADPTWTRRYLSARTWLSWAHQRGHHPDPNPPLRRVQPPDSLRNSAVLLLIDEYITSLDKADKTKQAYREDLTNIADTVATNLGTTLVEITLDQLNIRILEAGFATWRTSGGRTTNDGERSKNSRARAHAAWSSFYQWLIARDLATSNPLDAIDKPKISARDPKRLEATTDDDVIDAILTAAATPDEQARPGNRWPERDLAAVSLLLFCGLRRNELCSLNNNSIIRGHQELPRLSVIGKGDKPRTVPLTDDVVAILDDYLTSRQHHHPDTQPADNGPLVVDRHNQRLTVSQLGYLIKRIVSRSGVKKPERSLVHAFRHTYAYRLLSDGVPVNQVKDLLGHESLTTTQRYVQASGDELYDAQRLHSGLPALGRARATLQHTRTE